MKKFVFEIVLLFSLVAIPINYIYTINNLDKPPRVKQILSIDKKLDIINLGTSHGNNFYYSSLTIPGKGIHRSGNTLYYDLQNYKFIKKHLADSTVVLLPISYFSFGLDENRADKGTDISFVNDFYEYLPRTSIYEYSVKKDISLRANRMQIKFSALFTKKKTEKKKPKTVKKKKITLFDTVAHEKMLKKSAIKQVVHHKKIGSFTTPEKNINYLKILIENAQKSGHRPVLITVPYYKEYVKKFGEDNWLTKNYDQHMIELSERYDIPYLDYGIDDRLSFSPEFFKNSDHLNKKGIGAFNKILFADLIQLGLISEDELRYKKKK